MKFYKDATTGLWHISDFIMPEGTLMMRIMSQNTVQLMYKDGAKAITQFPINVSTFLDESETAYADMEAFLAATKAFFFRLWDLKTNAIELSAVGDNEKPFIVKDKDGNIVAFIDSNGFKEIRYRDEYVGGPWLTPQGVAAPDVVTVTIGGVVTQCYSFDGGNTEERISNNFEIAHDLPIDEINAGTLKIEWHNHFRPSTTGAGDVKMFFDWSYSPPGAAPIPMTSLSVLNTIAADKQYHHLLAGVELPVPAGGYAIGGIIEFTLRRTPSDTQDTYADDVLLIKTALHVPTNDHGSRQMYFK